MANNNEKLYITISDNRGQTSGASGKPTPNSQGIYGNNTSESNDEIAGSLLGRYAEHQMFHLVKDSVIKDVNYNISNIGNLTGDYITQRQVNYVKGAVSNMINIGATTFAGFKIAGVKGAVAGFVVGVGSLALSSFYEDKTNRIENAKNNFNIEMLRERVGLNTIYDGSRGTEN